VTSSEDLADMTAASPQPYDAGVVIIGFGAAGGGAAIEAHDAGVNGSRTFYLRMALVGFRGLTYPV